jgi:hypothetical protein
LLAAGWLLPGCWLLAVGFLAGWLSGRSPYSLSCALFSASAVQVVRCPLLPALACCLFKAAYLVPVLALLMNWLFAFPPQLTDPSASLFLSAPRLIAHCLLTWRKLSQGYLCHQGLGGRGREMELERTGGGLFLGFRSRTSSGGFFTCLERAGRPLSAAAVFLCRWMRGMGRRPLAGCHRNRLAVGSWQDS